MFYADLDGDTFGDPSNTQLACTQPNFFTTNSDDCNDECPYAVPRGMRTWITIAMGILIRVQSMPYLTSLMQMVMGMADCRTRVYATNKCDVWVGIATIHDPVQNLDDADGDGFTLATMIVMISMPLKIHRSWYVDVDGDGFGDPTNCNLCEPANPSDVLDGTDCNDADATENPTVTWYADPMEILTETQQVLRYALEPIPCVLTHPTVMTRCHRKSTVTCTLMETPTVMQPYSPVNVPTDADNTDCDDTDATEEPTVMWYADSDGMALAMQTVAMLVSECLSDVLDIRL